MSDADKNPKALEREADEARESLRSTVDALSNRLSPGELLDQALGMAREHGGEFGKNLGAQVKHNPVPLLLTGVGITWLMAASSSPKYAASASPERYGAGPQTLGVGATAHPPNMGTTTGNPEEDSGGASTGERLKQGAFDARDKVRGSAHAATDKVRDAGENLSAKAQSAKESLSSQATEWQQGAQYRAHQLQRSFEDTLQEQPLLLGALGMALGAGLGALFPSTEREDRVMGRTRDQVVERGQQAAAEQYEKGRQVVEETAGKVRESVSESPSGSGS